MLEGMKNKENGNMYVKLILPFGNNRDGTKIDDNNSI